MVVAELMRVVLPVVLVGGLVLVLLPRAAGRIVASLLGRGPTARRSPRARRLGRLRVSSGTVAVIAALVGARAVEAAVLGGGNLLSWLIGGAAGVLILAGVIGVRVTSRLLAAEPSETSRRVA